MRFDFRKELVALLPRLRAFALSLTRSQVEADDLVQAACERALRARTSYRDGTKFDAWVMRILHNYWIDTYRQRRRETLVDTADPAHDRVGSDGRAIVEDRSELSTTWRLIAAMPEDQRSVLTLVCADGLSYRDAAEVLDIPVGTIMSRLARARKTLAQNLQEPGATPISAGAQSL